MLAWIDQNGSSDLQGVGRFRRALASWIWSATRQLSQAARAEIEVLIRQRVDLAVERLTSEGLDEVNAWKQAIADLGVPGRAAHQYSREFLTAEEEKRLRQLSLRQFLGQSRVILKLIFFTLTLFLFSVNGQMNLPDLIFYLFAGNYIGLSGDVIRQVVVKNKVKALRYERYLSPLTAIILSVFYIYKFYQQEDMSRSAESPFALIGISIMTCTALIAVDFNLRSLIRKLERGAV